MDLKNLSVFNAAHENMRYLTAKQQVIAENIANASTPGYLAKDIKKIDFQQELSAAAKLPLNVTNNKHLLPDSKAQSVYGYQVYTPQPSDALTIDGNGVILEEQMNAASKASSEYKRMITIYNKYKAMMKLATTKISA